MDAFDAYEGVDAFCVWGFGRVVEVFEALYSDVKGVSTQRAEGALVVVFQGFLAMAFGAELFETDFVAGIFGAPLRRH